MSSVITVIQQTALPSVMVNVSPTVFLIGEDNRLPHYLEPLIRRAGWTLQTLASVQDFLESPRAFVPHCVLLTFSRLDANNIDVQRQIVRQCAETPIVVISNFEDIPTTVHAMKAGAVDFLVVPFSNEDLLRSIQQAMERSRAALDHESEMHSVRSRYASLTPRERQVMTLVASGLLNKQVAAELAISEITVKAHRGKMMQKMKADSLAELVKMSTRLQTGDTGMHLVWRQHHA